MPQKFPTAKDALSATPLPKTSQEPTADFCGGKGNGKSKQAQVSERIDLVLAVLEVITPPGHIWTLRDIGDIVGVRHQTIWYVEFRAMKKFKDALYRSGFKHVYDDFRNPNGRTRRI